MRDVKEDRFRAITQNALEGLATKKLNLEQMQNLHPDPEPEAIGMRAVMEYERSQGRQVDDVHEKNLGYDITSLDTSSGELRLIEIKGLAGETGTVALTPNEKRVVEDRR